MARALALCALAACSYPEKILIDAQGTPFGCLNAPPPTTADSPVTISGITDDAFQGTPIANVAVALTGQGSTTPIFTAQSDAMGRFSRVQATGGVPLDLYAVASANGFLTTYFYPPRPVTHDTVFPIVLFTSADSTTLAGMAGLTFNANDSQMFLRVTDCNGTPVAGATVTTSPAGSKIVYFSSVHPAPAATSTDQMGIVLVANLPPGNVMVNATVSGMNFKTLSNLESVAGTYLQTTIQP